MLTKVSEEYGLPSSSVCQAPSASHNTCFNNCRSSCAMHLARRPSGTACQTPFLIDPRHTCRGEVPIEVIASFVHRDTGLYLSIASAPTPIAPPPSHPGEHVQGQNGSMQ